MRLFAGKQADQQSRETGALYRRHGEHGEGLRRLPGTSGAARQVHSEYHGQQPSGGQDRDRRRRRYADDWANPEQRHTSQPHLPPPTSSHTAAQQHSEFMTPEMAASLPHPETWECLSSIWLMEDRPQQMRNPLIVGKLTLSAALEMKRHHEELQAKLGREDAVFGRDNAPPTKMFPESGDNCADMLHDARWERMPIKEIKEYWRKIPTKRSHIYRRLPLEHHGAAAAVSECVIVRAHDRSLPLKLSMFNPSNSTKRSLGSSENKDPADGWESPKAILDIQEALANFAAVYYCLWHMDPTPQILQRMLIHYNYGSAPDRSEKEQCRLIADVVDEILRTNSSRAVASEPPLSFRECRERWKDAAERRHGSSTQQGNQRKGGERQGNMSGGRDRFRAADSKSGRIPNRGGQQAKAKVLKYKGNLICFLYNKATGCNRPRKFGGCDDGRNGVYAHVCNYEDAGGKPCYQQHCSETWRH